MMSWSFRLPTTMAAIFEKLGGLPSDVWRLVFPYISSRDLLRLSTLTQDLRRLCLQCLPLTSKKTCLSKSCSISNWKALQTDTWGYAKNEWRILDLCFWSGDIVAILQNVDASRTETQLRYFSYKGQHLGLLRKEKGIELVHVSASPSLLIVVEVDHTSSSPDRLRLSRPWRIVALDLRKARQQPAAPATALWSANPQPFRVAWDDVGGIAVDPIASSIFVSDTCNDRIVILDANTGAALQQLTGFRFPNSIAIGGSYFAVSDAAQVKIFSLNTLTMVRSQPLKDMPAAMDFDPNGRLFLSFWGTTENDRIEVLSKSGAVARYVARPTVIRIRDDGLVVFLSEEKYLFRIESAAVDGVDELDSQEKKVDTNDESLCLFD